MHSVESRFVTGPLNILFSGVYVCTFHPGNFTDWVMKGLNVENESIRLNWKKQQSSIGKGSIRAAIFIRCLGCLNAEKRVYNFQSD